MRFSFQPEFFSLAGYLFGKGVTIFMGRPKKYPAGSRYLGSSVDARLAVAINLLAEKTGQSISALLTQAIGDLLQARGVDVHVLLGDQNVDLRALVSRGEVVLLELPKAAEDTVTPIGSLTSGQVVLPRPSVYVNLSESPASATTSVASAVASAAPTVAMADRALGGEGQLSLLELDDESSGEVTRLTRSTRSDLQEEPNPK